MRRARHGGHHAMVQWLWDIRYIDAPVLRWRDTGGDPDLDETIYYCNDAKHGEPSPITQLPQRADGRRRKYVASPYFPSEMCDCCCLTSAKP